MRQAPWAVLILASIVGCQGNPPRFDPFMGPSTVPPPSTAGAVLLPPGDPYAPQAAPLGPPPAVSPQGVPFVPQNSAPTVAPPFAPPGGLPPATMPGAAPPGGFQYRQSSIAPLPGNELVAVAPPAAAATGVAQASYQAPSVAPVTQPKESQPTDDRYGHDAAYSKLRGQLDYSAIDQSWRLRYIPLSGDMDDYGGSVRLREHAALAERAPGEFVELTGQIDAPSADGFAPWYRVTEIRVIATK